MMEVDINYNKCMARTKQNPEKQCNNSKKTGDFCGVHKEGKYLYRIDEEIPHIIANIAKKNAKILKKHTCVSKSTHSIQNHIIVNLFDFDRSSLDTISIESIRFNIEHYKLHINDKMDERNEFCAFLERLNKYKSYTSKIVKCQSHVRGRRQRVINELRGPGFKNRTICVNDEDFYTFDQKDSIPYESFFSYKDEDNYIYCFDIKSFANLIKLNQNNPYNRKIINSKAIMDSNKLMTLLGIDKLSIGIDKSTLTADQKFRESVMVVFQKLDNLNYYTDIEWFINLNLQQLRKLYLSIEDIWHWRANLTAAAQRKILPTGAVFTIGKYQIEVIQDKRVLQDILLTDINKLISMGETV